MKKTILIPTDFSRLSREAVDIGVALARVLPAKVLLMHSITQPEGVEELSAAYDEYYAYTRDQISGTLEELAKAIEKEGVEVETLLVNGIPHEEIIKTAAQEGVEMIVMGTHGRRGWNRLLMGSQAEQVVRSASCPVITVKGTPAQAPPEPSENPTENPREKVV
jgi:nucleotide-binding universal stress UspA family protein